MNSIGQRIVTRRREMGLSQTALSRSSSVSRPHLAVIEASGVNPNVNTLIRIAKSLDLRLSELVDGV